MATIQQILKCRDRWLSQMGTGQASEALAQSTLEACRESVAQLGAQLSELKYPVQQFLFPCRAGLSSRIAKIQKHTRVPIPKVLGEFWRIVGGISLVDLKDYQHVAFWDELGVTAAFEFSDGLHVDACDAEWLEFAIDDFDEFSEQEDDDGDGDDEDEEDDDSDSQQAELFLYILSPDGYHKDDISGGEPYAIGRKSDWLPTWENFTWSGHRRPETAPADPPDFVSYLRTAILECAGFPGFLGDPAFEALRQKLVRDLRPF